MSDHHSLCVLTLSTYTAVELDIVRRDNPVVACKVHRTHCCRDEISTLPDLTRPSEIDKVKTCAVVGSLTRDRLYASSNRKGASEEEKLSHVLLDR